MSSNLHQEKGFGIIEIIIALSLFLIVAVVGVSTVVGSFTVNRLGEEETQATVYAQQGLEAVRSIRNQGWTAPFLDQSCTSGCGVSIQSNLWDWFGSSNQQGKYVRTLTVTGVNRNVSGVIVQSGGSNDPDTKKVTSTVTWTFSPLRSNSLSLSTYLTNFEKSIVGNWTAPSVEANVNLSSSDDGYRVQTSGNFAYVIKNSGSQNFQVINVATPAAPTVVGSLTLAGTPQNLVVSGSYVYVASTDNNQELQIINVSNPSSPVLAGSLNDSGSDDALGVSVAGSYAYLAMRGGNDLVIANITTPSAPSYVGGMALNSNPTDIVVQGNYAYLSSIDNSQELQVVSVANPAAPTVSATLDLPGTSNADTLAKSGNTLFIGQGTALRSVSVSNPLAPSLLGSLNIAGTVLDVALDLASSGSYAFLATTDDTYELQVISVSSPTAMSRVGSVNTPGSDNLNGAAYSPTLDRVFAVGQSNTQELVIVRPL